MRESSAFFALFMNAHVPDKQIEPTNYSVHQHQCYKIFEQNLNSTAILNETKYRMIFFQIVSIIPLGLIIHALTVQCFLHIATIYRGGVLVMTAECCLIFQFGLENVYIL